jgi:CheY-like chemotaxis protein
MANGSVLVVDDEPNIALSLEYLMKEQGFEVRVARDGEAALEALRERLPDVMLLDVMLPKRDGYEVCQTVRANADWKRADHHADRKRAGRSSRRRGSRSAPTTTSPSRSRPAR